MKSSSCALIFVPGIRAKPDPLAQQAQLRRCLQSGLQRAGTAPALAADMAAALELVGWSRGFYGVDGDINPDLPGIERLLSTPPDPAADRREATAPARRLVAWLYTIGDHMPGLGSLFTTRRMRTRLADINRYFDDIDGAGSSARALLADRLRAAWAQQQPVLLIGHSFGSVIAYDTLWELSREEQAQGQVALFLTLGSPLALRYIRHRLRGATAKGPARYPTNIRHWRNLAAVGELAVRDLRISDTFADLPSCGLVESMADDLSLLNSFRGPDGYNPHKCYGYFANSQVAEVLRDAWQRAIDVRE